MTKTTVDIETGKQSGKPLLSKTDSRSTTSGGAPTPPDVHFDDPTINSENSEYSEIVDKKSSSSKTDSRLTTLGETQKVEENVETLVKTSKKSVIACKSVGALSFGVSTATFAVTKPFSSNIINSALFSLGVGAVSGAVLAGAIALSYGIHKLWTWEDATTPKKINEQAEKLIPQDPEQAKSLVSRDPEPAESSLLLPDPKNNHYSSVI